MSKIYKPTWINTFVETQYNPETDTFEVIRKEGYWYVGPIALAASPPVLEQTDWAFYNDGTESGSTIIGTKNTNPTLALDTTYLFRAGVEETAGNAARNQTSKLQFSHNSGTWTNITTATSPVRLWANGNIADGDHTTQRITAFSYDTTNAGFDDVDGIAGSGVTDLNNNGYEALWSIRFPTGGMAYGDTIEFKVVNEEDGDTDYIYNQTNASPTVTVPIPALHDQDSVRGYSDGTESGSTALAAANVGWTATYLTDFHIRFVIQQTQTAPDPDTNLTIIPALQYSRNSGGWTNVTT